MKLDRTRSFGITSGDPRVRYMQDGKEFDKEGNCLSEVEEAKPASKPDGVVEAAPTPKPKAPIADDSYATPRDDDVEYRPAERFKLRK